ncbi:MAG: hypothetical protein ACRELB_18480, partial [Polyangiaceae bacterium]
SCQGCFTNNGRGNTLAVDIVSGAVGSLDQPLPISVFQPTPFTVDITAQLPDGSTDTSFEGYVNVLSQPGTVSDLDVRNVQLHDGVYQGLVVPVVGAFGETHIWADDLGYKPVAPTSNPQCSDGKDNNGNGLIDYPADPGCYAPVDDTEDLGTYASGASQTIYFERPRIPLVRGYDPANNGNGNATLFPNTQVSIDTGWRGGTSFAFSTVVIGLTAAGFYAQDLQTDLPQPPPGYSGIYAYNFSTPAFMRVCDRVQVLSGTSSDFYGFTELNYPTWQLEFWDPSVRPCLVPEPSVLAVSDLGNKDRLWQVEATLVRIETAGTVSIHVAHDFGAQDVPIVNGVYTPSETASNCDYDHNGKVNFTDGANTPSEANCAVVCDGSSAANPTDFECSEYSQFASQSDFEFIVTDSATGQQARIQADASAADLFDPVASRGQTLRSFTGLVSYFSGGSQFTIQARCQDDVVTDLNSSPLTSNVACVHPRTSSDINANSQ